MEYPTIIGTTLTFCFNCESKVFEFESGIYGCDNCKAVWKHDGRGWINIEKKSRMISPRKRKRK